MASKLPPSRHQRPLQARAPGVGGDVRVQVVKGVEARLHLPGLLPPSQQDGQRSVEVGGGAVARPPQQLDDAGHAVLQPLPPVVTVELHRIQASAEPDHLSAGRRSWQSASAGAAAALCPAHRATAAARTSPHALSAR